MYAAWQNLTNNHNWSKTLPDIELTYVPFKKQKFSKIHLWAIAGSSFSKLNFHTSVMVLLSLRNWKTMFKSIGMCQIELVFYRSSNSTPKSAHTTSKKHLQNSKTLSVWKFKSYKCLPIPKTTIKREFIPDPKHIISIINAFAPTNQLVRDNVSVLESLRSDVSTALNHLKNKPLVFLTGDWNFTVEKKNKKHASDNCIGSFTRGVRNNSGQHLVDFCAIITFSSATRPFNTKLLT